jgi:hypothetical protein
MKNLLGKNLVRTLSRLAGGELREKVRATH